MTDNLGRRLRQLRDAKGWSMEHLAEKVGCSANTINLIEHGYTEQSRYLPRIAAALETTVEYLVQGDRRIAEDPTSYRPIVARIAELAETGRIDLRQLRSLAQLAETFAETRR